MDLPPRLHWLKSGRFLRLLSALAALAILAAVLYNAIMVDRVPPTYSVGLTSATGNGQAMTLSSIYVDFSEPVRQDTVQSAFSLTPSVPYTFYWQGRNLIVTPTSRLPISTVFHVHIGSGIEDLAGNAQGNTKDFNFTTVGSPAVVAVQPAREAKSISVDASITVTFDRIMDTQKVLEGLTLKPDITYQASWNGAVLTLDPTQPLAYGTTYTLQIADPAVDTDGTVFPPYSMSFTTVGIGLRVAAVVPAANVAGVSVHSQIAVIFDGPIDPSSVNGAIAMTPPVSGSTRAISLPDDSGQLNPAEGSPAAAVQNVLVFTPNNPLAPHTTYTVASNSTVKRTDGQVAEGKTWQFTTGDSQALALNQIAFTSHRSGVSNVWLMNPDGSNQREVTSELVPISGYDISGDGTTIYYAASGVIKKMSMDGGSLSTVTSGGNFEYSPAITPDGTGLIVGRRSASGLDLGYWRYPLTGGGDAKQVVPDGAPAQGSVKMPADGLTGLPGMAAWASRAAISTDGTTMLLVRGADSAVDVVDLTGAQQPLKLPILGNSRPIWVQSDGAFYLAGSTDNGLSWSCWRVVPAGTMTDCGQGRSDMASSGSALALIIQSSDASDHLSFATAAGVRPIYLANEPGYDEIGASFSPDGADVVFGRVGSVSTGISAGIWTVGVDGTNLVNLSTDGAWPRWIP